MAEKQLLQSGILGKLRSLGMMLRGRLVAEGLAWLMVSLVCLVMVTLVFDYVLRLDRAQRALILGLCGVGVLVVVYRGLLAPLLVPMDRENLALLVERHYSRLGDRLISALQFAGQGHAVAAGVSGDMIQRMADEANTIAADLKFSKIVDTKRLGKLWAIAGIIVLMLGGFGVLRADVMKLWFQRSILLADVDWPQNTYLSVHYIDKDGRLQPLLKVDKAGKILTVCKEVELLRGDDLEVVITATGSVDPDSVTLHAWYPSVGDTEDKIFPVDEITAAKLRKRLDIPSSRDGGKRKQNRKQNVFVRKIPAISEELTFYITGGDDSRDGRQPHQLRLVDPPALSKLRFAVEYPAYMHRSDRDRMDVLDGGRGVLPVPLGATVRVTAQANKDLRGAQILLDGLPVGQVKLEAVGKDKTARRQFRGMFTITGKNEARTATLKFLLEDTAGYVNRRGEQYVVQIRPDLMPTVKLRSRGVRQVICPTAMIPLIAQAGDDCGVRSIQITYRKELPKDETDTGETGKAELPPKPEKPIKVAGPIISSEIKRKLRGERILDIEPLKLPVGTRLRIIAAASDLLPKEFAGPNVTQSAELTFNVISREQLFALLVGRQKEVRMEFFQAMGQQEFSRGRCEAVARQAAAGAIGADASGKLADAANKQRQVISESTKAADTLNAVALEMELNRLGKAEEYQAIRSDIVIPLRSLVGDMRQVVVDFDKARKLTDAGELAARTKQIAKDQADIYRKMEEIIKHMRKLENRLELARRLEGLLKMAIEMDAILRKQVEQTTVEIFEEEKEKDED
ncbi:MAG: hypothetical protein K8S55_16225 [Phycisphaerae bacterium]|nr:hypothetical protein [Phycisphaerae bacterium]